MIRKKSAGGENNTESKGDNKPRREHRKTGKPFIGTDIGFTIQYKFNL